MTGKRTLRAPRGTELSCKGWVQEAAFRMIQNNLDPENAEVPDQLIVYGGRGKAARNWESLDAILRELKELGDDQTLLVQSGKPVAVMPNGVNTCCCISSSHGCPVTASSIAPATT